MKLVKLVFLVAFYVLFSCQKEENILIENTNNQTLNKTDELVNLILRIAQNPTGFDNVLDGSSCFETKLPVSVEVNGQNLLISNRNDFQLIVEAQTNFPGNDEVNFIFPINIIFQNSETQVVNSQVQLSQIKATCTQRNNGFNELSCIDFTFPLTINVFNSNSLQANALVFLNKINFFNLIDNLNENDLFSFNFPVQMTNSNSETTTITSNSQLQDFIIAQIDNCTGGTISQNQNFIPTLTSNNWKISFFYEDDDDETDEYTQYKFTFNPNGILTVTENGIVSTGNWSSVFDVPTGYTKLTLSNFSDSNLQDLQLVWRLLEFNENNIHLRDYDTSDDDDYYLYFQKI